MDEVTVYDKFYRSRRLIVTYISNESINCFFGYIELKDKDKDINTFNNHINNEQLTFNPVFNNFYDKPSLRNDELDNGRIYFKFYVDTDGVKVVKKEDCIRALKNIVDRLETLKQKEG